MSSKWQKVIEEHGGKPMEIILRDLFKIHGSQRAVAKYLGISQSTLSIWLLKLNLEQQTILTVREVQS